MKTSFFLIATVAVLLSGNKSTLNNQAVTNTCNQCLDKAKEKRIDDLKSIFDQDSLEEGNANLENKNVL